MNSQKTIPIKIISKTNNAIYEQRESGITHSPFSLEYNLYQAIKLGDVTQVNNIIDIYLLNGLVVGSLSDNSIQQIQYWAVACISVAFHYAILGGLDETEAFNLSDVYIRKLDLFKSIDDCIPFLKEKAIELTTFVSNAKYKDIHSPSIRECLHYIHIHLHERLTIELLAKKLNISRDYLSVLFKKELGCNLHAYILQTKLETSKLLLAQNQTYENISYQLGFCSQTHYITCFKREYNMTPREYKEKQYPSYRDSSYRKGKC